VYLRRLKAAVWPAVNQPGWLQKEGAAFEDIVANEAKSGKYRN